MKDDKILKSEELTEEQLEEVAGGLGSEIKDDKRKFAGLGILRNENASDEELVRAFNRFGVNVETYHGYFTKNEYRINGNKVSRDDVWNYIYDRVR